MEKYNNFSESNIIIDSKENIKEREEKDNPCKCNGNCKNCPNKQKDSNKLVK